MSSNPLLNAIPKGRFGLKLSPQEWATRGNEYLASIGRHDVHWFVHNDHAVIGFKSGPTGQGEAPRLRAA